MNKFLVAAVMISAIAALNLARQLAQAPKLLSCDGHSARGNPRHCHDQVAVEAQPIRKAQPQRCAYGTRCYQLPGLGRWKRRPPIL